MASIYWALRLQFVHSTIAGNSSADGRGLVIDRFSDLLNPGAPDQIPAR